MKELEYNRVYIAVTLLGVYSFFDVGGLEMFYFIHLAAVIVMAIPKHYLSKFVAAVNAIFLYKSDSPKKDETTEKKLDWSIWNYLFLIVPIVSFILLRGLLWSMHKNALDAEVAEQMTYHLVWYNPECPSAWIVAILWLCWCMAIFRFGWRLSHWLWKIAWTLIGLFCLFMSFTFAVGPTVDISAIYFGQHKIAIVRNWQKNKIRIYNRARLSHTCKQVKDDDDYFQELSIFSARGKELATIQFDTDQNYKLLRFPFGAVPCDRKQVIRAITSLPEYKQEDSE
ncbi:MAG: hypothetical protein K6E73_09650 [Bacteroidales bacterium]|nr:hypothetical protein [Bacteroidales bacterium]